jgi:hypothetical protein
MIRTIKQIRGRTLAAQDGHIGHITDLFFDDAFWHVRYFVVATGSGPDQRKVLIAPEAVRPADWTEENFPVDLTMDQVRRSPRVETDQPVSRQQEQELRGHYGWPMYWDMGLGLGGVIAGVPPPVIPVRTATTDQPPGNPNLRSAETTLGYRLEATDGAIGHVEEFLVDERSWQIRYLVVDTRNWLPGRMVVIAPAWIESTDWARRHLVVNLTKDAIKHSPPYDPDLQWNPAYSAELHEHYRRPHYTDWDKEVVPDDAGRRRHSGQAGDSGALFPPVT